jgi:hypothetical protein
MYRYTDIQISQIYMDEVISHSKPKTADGYFVTKTSVILLTDLHPSQRQFVDTSIPRVGGSHTDILDVRVFFHIDNSKAIFQTYAVSGTREIVEASIKMDSLSLGVLTKMLNKEDILLDEGGRIRF